MEDSTKADEISQDEIDDFLAASSDSDEDDQSDAVAGITVFCADRTDSLFDSVDGDPWPYNTLQQRDLANHGLTAATKDDINQEDIDAFLADDSDSDSEITAVTNNLENTNENKRDVTGSPTSCHDGISKDEIDDFLANCTDTDDVMPIMDVVKHLGSQDSASAEKAEVEGATLPTTVKFEATSAKISAPAAAGSSADSVEETIEEKMMRMQAEMDHMRKQLEEQKKEKLQAEETSPATKKRVSFGHVETKRLREAETDLFSSPSQSKTSNDYNQSTKNSHSKELSPGSSGMAAGHRKINAKGISKEDASKIVGPLSFYKKEEESRPADDSGSDWDDMEGEKPYLSKEGRNIKKMLNGDRRRVAHTPKYESGEFSKRKDTWMGKSSCTSRQASVRGESSQGSKTSKKEFEDCDYMKERYSGIRIINPLISNAVMKMRMEKRKMIKMSELSLTSKNYLNDCDWVTIGVLVSKSDTRKSSSGKNYLVWKLSDLEDCDKVVSLFLFGECYAKLWKENTGIVVGVLNPSFMAPSEKSSSKNEVCLTIDHPQKVMMMGKSKDLGRCQSKTKAGNFCTNVVNKRTGEYCTYHVQRAYRKTSSKRPALQAGFNAPVPRSFEQKLFTSGQEVFYGGQSFSSESFKRQKKSEKVTLNSMNQHKKPGTMSLAKLQPEDEQKLKDLVSTKKEAFQDMLQRPTVGAINFMKHLQVAEKVEKEKKQKDQPMASITFTDFLKEAQQEIDRTRKGAKLPQAAGSSSQASGVTPVPAMVRPQLGRGLAPGADIFLESPTKNSKGQDSIWGAGAEENHERSSLPGVSSSLKSISRKQAAAKLKKNIEQQDPNRVKKKVSPEAQQRIKKRLLETVEEKENPSESTPPSKKPRILGGLDIDSEEVQKLLKEGSSHKGAVNDVITEAEEKYFKALECKESMEEKMSKITRVVCSVVSCKLCKYTAQKPADRCKQLGHDLVRTKAMKQFFKCCDCGNRCIAFDKYPKRSCKKCGGSRYERTSMLAERKGVKLDSEKLLLRGEEQKFLNSLN